MSQTEQTAPATAPRIHNIAMRFLTQGGATVELYNLTFRTDLDGRGYYAGGVWSEVEGTNWSCTGCDRVGKDGQGGTQLGYRRAEAGRARDEANAHAETCRSMPRPTA